LRASKKVIVPFRYLHCSVVAVVRPVQIDRLLSESGNLFLRDSLLITRLPSV
jgi:hypothetical protein